MVLATYFPSYPSVKPLGGSTFVCPISVGQEYHEGEIFSSLIDLLHSVPDAKIIIIVCDILQRYTLAMHSLFNAEIPSDVDLDREAEKMLEQAKIDGDAWITRNIDKIDPDVRNSIEILRWQDYKERSDFNLFYEIILRKYKEDREFRVAIHRTCGKFLAHFAQEECVDFDPVIAFNLSKAYILEECAVFLQWYKEGKCTIVYPMKNSPMHNVMKDRIAQYLGELGPSDLPTITFLEIKSKKVSSANKN